LINPEVSSSTVASHQKLCASKVTYDLIKRELFRRAAQLRGSDQAAYDKLSAYAVARMENPVLESEDSSTGAVNCSGSLSIDLPPGVTVVGSPCSGVRRRLRSARGRRERCRRSAQKRRRDHYVARDLGTGGAAAKPWVIETNEGVPDSRIDAAARTASRCRGPQLLTRLGRARLRAHSRGRNERLRGGGLAALDLSMAAEYRRAFTSPEQRDLLRRPAIFSRYRIDVRTATRCRCLCGAHAGTIMESAGNPQGNLG
jgi:hypothetical protein